MSKTKVTVVKKFEGIVDTGDLPSNGLQYLLEHAESTDHDVNVWELALDEVENSVLLEDVR